MGVKPTTNNGDKRFQSKFGLIFGYGAMLAFMAFLVMIALFGMEATQRQLKVIVNSEVAKKVELSSRMQAAARERTLALQQMILISDPFEQDDLIMKFSSLASDFIKAREQLLAMELSAKEHAIIEKQGKNTGIAVPLQKQVVALIQDEQYEKANKILLQQAVPAQNEVLKVLDKFHTYQQTLGQQAIEQAEKVYAEERYRIIVLSFGLVLIATFIAGVLVRRMLKSTEDREKQLDEIENMNMQLMVARDKAQEANRAKSAFLANMSHELRTPLNAIIGYSQLINDEVKTSDTDAFFSNDLDKIEQSGKHLLTLINDILELSKIEMGKTELYIEDLKIPALVKSVVDTIEPLMEKNNNKLEVNVTHNIESIQTDPVKLKQILLNLLSNAAKFTENGKITLRVDTIYTNNKPWITFTVNDTGIGMDKDIQQKLFTSFYQGDTSTQKKFGGTGLGLSISQHFAGMLGGNIQVKSEPSKGTQFTVMLPLHEDISNHTALAS